MIRKADILDIDWILNQTTAFADFYGSKIRLDADKDYGRKLITELIEKHLVLISEDNGVNKGFIAGMQTPHHFNPSIRVLAELLWWVPEEFRFSGVGKELLDEFIAYGKANCDWITFTMEDKTPASDRALTRHGFEFKEKTYLLEV